MPKNYANQACCAGVDSPRAKLLLGENLLHGNDLLMKALSARRSLIEEWRLLEDDLWRINELIAEPR
jgi:hypothetical protein